MALRDYQQRIFDGVGECYRRGVRRVMVVSPTGSGKTHIFVHVARAVVAKRKRVCILAHRAEIVDQTSRALEALGVEHGLIAAGRSAAPGAVQVASVQTLVRRLHRHQHFDLIIADECHHAIAGQWRKIIAAYPQAYLLGTTATPERLDGAGLGDVFEEMILGPSVRDLIVAGHLSPATVYAPADAPDLSGIRTRMGDFDQAALGKVMTASTITGNAVEHYRRLCAGMPAVAFCVSVDHARQVAAQFRAAGLRSTHLDGMTDAGERRRTITALGQGGLDVLTSCDIVSEGTDIPVIGAAILLRPTQSLGLYLQQVGRSLRPFPGKERAIILDHAGNSRRHGLPDDAREWTLEGRPRKKRAAAEDGPAVRQCPSCFAMNPGFVAACQACGTAFKVEARAPREVEGELVEVTETERALAYAPFKEVMAWAGKDEARLRKVAKARGYHHLWVKRQLGVPAAWRGRAA